jgi:hypothetical protein
LWRTSGRGGGRETDVRPGGIQVLTHEREAAR